MLRDGRPFRIVPIPAGDHFTYRFRGSGGPARYRIQVDRLLGGVASIEATSSPIYVESR